MALIFDHNAANSWRRSAYASAPSLVPRASASNRPTGSFSSNLASNLNKVTTMAGGPDASRATMELPANFNLAPPGRGLSPAALATGQNSNNVNLNPPSSMAYAGLTANRGQALSGQRDGLAQINSSVNRAAARGQYTAINTKISNGEKTGASTLNAFSSRSQSRQYYEKLAEQAAERHGVDPNLVKAVITAESDYNPNVVSKAGAMGLMQLMPGTARDMQVKNPFDPVQNIEGGTRYLAWLSQQFNGDESKILAAYNWGPGNVRRGGNMPSETRNYLVKVRDFKNQYKQLARREDSQTGQAAGDNMLLAKAGEAAGAASHRPASAEAIDGSRGTAKLATSRRADQADDALSL